MKRLSFRGPMVPEMFDRPDSPTVAKYYFDVFHNRPPSLPIPSHFVRTANGCRCFWKFLETNPHNPNTCQSGLLTDNHGI